MFTNLSFPHVISAACMSLSLALSPSTMAEDLPVGLSEMEIGDPRFGYVLTELGDEFDFLNFREWGGTWLAGAHLGAEFSPSLSTWSRQEEVLRNESGYEIDFSIFRSGMLWTNGGPQTYKHEVMVSQYVDYETHQDTDLRITFDRMTQGIWTDRGALVVVRDQNGTIQPEFVSIPVASQWRYELPAGSAGRIEVWHFYAFEGSVLPGDQLEFSDQEDLRIKLNFSNPADTNGDGLVDGQDMAAVLGAWGEQCDGCAEDIDNNGIVGGSDLTLILAGWNTGLN